MTDYFNIAGYWFFNEKSNPMIPLIVSILLQAISFWFIRKLFKNKGKVVMDYEKQIS